MKSIKTRLMMYIFIIVIIPIIAFMVYSFVFVNREVQNTKIDAIETKINWSEQYLSSVNDQLEDLIYAIHIEDDLLDDIDQMYVDASNVENMIRNALYVNNHLVSAISVFSVNSLNQISIDYERGIYKSTLPLDGLTRNILDEPTGSLFVLENGSIKVYHSINNFNTQALMGGVVLTLNDNLTTELHAIFGSSAEFTLLSSQGMITESNESLAEQTDLINLYNNQDAALLRTEIEDDTLFIKQVGQNALYVVATVPTASINALNNDLINMALIVLVVIIALIVPTSIIFSRRITVPIIGLVDHMKEFDFSLVETNAMPYDEIHLLEKSYNQMIEQVNQLIQDSYLSEIERKNAQLKALQAQINPHFLANTFQLIGGMALSVQADDIYQATIKMSHLLRYAMHIDTDASTLGAELEHIKDYLDIQKLRFGKRLNFKLDIPKTYLNLKLPKFCLQPIIENSFKHGLKTIKEDWLIEMDIDVSDVINIRIVDNGISIDEDNMNIINQRFEAKENRLKQTDQNQQSGIALENVDARIKLLYGNAYGLCLSQKEAGRGLVVAIRIPKEAKS